MGSPTTEGVHRQVNYVADHAGFRAQVKTNEPGTANQNPAAVHMISDAPSYDHHGYAGHGYAGQGYAGHGYAGHVAAPVVVDGHHGHHGYGYAALMPSWSCRCPMACMATISEWAFGRIGIPEIRLLNSEEVIKSCT
ncbi:hypothetical protein CEXT_168651 [Caerostris extrusa]|uniref:Uncharacterized protein n=1 Tax=Caerostris extrusa TaxID=172846 RepID=A0AAV4UFN3_CAEEX|nr:hypothetical protein CEXT_168651 [Caerostris extrusa]